MIEYKTLGEIMQARDKALHRLAGDADLAMLYGSDSVEFYGSHADKARPYLEEKWQFVDGTPCLRIKPERADAVSALLSEQFSIAVICYGGETIYFRACVIPSRGGVLKAVNVKQPSINELLGIDEEDEFDGLL